MYEIDGNFIIRNGYKQPLYMAPDKTKAYSIKKFDLDNGKLLPFQFIGSCFLLTRKKAILGDIMGLGKTIQSLKASEYIMKRDNSKFSLIISPKPLLDQWKKEIHRFTIFKGQILKDFEDLHERYIITNYEKIYKDGFEQILKKKPILILDEATKLKNFDTKYSQELYKSNISDYVFMLSGTVYENSPVDLWSLFKQLKNNYLDYNYYDFINKYAVIEKRVRLDGQEYSQITGWKNLDDLKSKIEPLILRRNFKDVAFQLPEKTVEDIFVELSKEELQVYNRIKKEILMAKGEEYVLALFTILKRFLDYPDVLEKNNLTKKFVFKHVDSSKSAKLLELVDSMRDEKIVIFTQYSDVAEALGSLLKTKFLYYGDMTNEVIDEFKRVDKGILIMTDKGAYGLNLQSASIVINYDLHWNPAVLEQRIGRVYRMGQKKNVLVLNLIVNEIGLIERYIRLRLKEKTAIGNKLLSKA